MKATLLLIGKTESSYLKEGIKIYTDRLKHYIQFEMVEIPALKNNKNMSVEQQKEAEGALILAKLSPTDEVWLLDEKGKQYSSESFAEMLDRKMYSGTKNIVFIVGGPYGFSSKVYQTATALLSLSAMTFSHQMVRLVFTEQLYRAMTIIKGEPYHHK